MKQPRNDAERYKKKILTIPNSLSLFRIGLIPAMIWLYCVEHDSILTGFLLLLSGATDIVDGFIARRFHMVSDLGKVLDPIADKLTQGAMLVCLLTHFPPIIIPLILLVVKETYMGVSGLLVIQKTGNVLGASWHGKAATCLLYGMLMLHIFWHDIPTAASTISIAACTGMIGISFVLYAIRNTRALKHRRF